MAEAVYENITLDFDFQEENLKQKLVESNPIIEPIRSKIHFKFALSLRQRHEIIEIARSYNDTHEIMITTQLYTGCRAGEITNIEISDVNVNDPENAFFYLQKKTMKNEKGENILKWKPKTDAGVRRIPLYPDIAKKINRYIGKYRRKKGYLFLSNKKGKFRVDSYIDFINKYARECKTIGRDIGSHTMRRTYASFLINEKVPIGIISKRLGHASIEITMKYLFQIDSPEEDEIVKNALKKML